MPDSFLRNILSKFLELYSLIFLRAIYKDRTDAPKKKKRKKKKRETGRMSLVAWVIVGYRLIRKLKFIFSETEVHTH